MPDHVHILLRQHRHRVDELIQNVQSASPLRLSVHLTENHPVWTTGGYNRFILTPQQMHKTINYIASNPLKEGLPAQLGDFIQPYTGWLPGKIPSHPSLAT
jgi:REP element-mobilizing transposase RayT